VKVNNIYSMINELNMRGDCSFCWYWWDCWPSLGPTVGQDFWLINILLMM